MAKYSIAPDDIQKIVMDVAQENGLAQIGIDFQAFVTTKGKDVVKVVKANECAEIVSNRTDLVFVLIRQDVFDAVDEKSQYLWIRMALSTVDYDGEKEKILIGCPMLSVPIKFYEQYGETAVDAALLQNYTLEQVIEKEKEAKAAAKAEKKGRGKRKSGE
jgi:hypothetical protein